MILVVLHVILSQGIIETLTVYAVCLWFSNFFLSVHKTMNYMSDLIVQHLCPSYNTLGALIVSLSCVVVTQNLVNTAGHIGNIVWSYIIINDCNKL